MLFKNFIPGSDYISINYDGKYFDLHNDYEFIGMLQNEMDNVLCLNFNKRNDNWIANEAIDNFSLKFTEVKRFWFRERDNDDFPEDAKVLSMIGFSTDDDFMDGVLAESIENPTLIIIFEDGRAIKVASHFAELIETEN